MKRIMLAAAAALLLSVGAATAVQAATTAPAPPGVHVSGMTYQPGAHLPATHLPRITPFNAALRSGNWSGYADGHRGDQPERDTWQHDLERAVDHQQHHHGEQRR